MDNIKIKLWDIETKTMIPPEKVCHLDGELSKQAKDYNFIPLLFTDLTDKNGKEIYEGDIVKIQTKISHEQIEFKAIIQFRNGCFWFDGIDATITDCNWHFYNSSDIEVIGNIFENPELKEIKQ